MNIAIVDDKMEDRQIMIQYLHKYQKQNHLEFQILEYDNGAEFLNDIDQKYIDIVFLDIYMDVLGVDIAKTIREKKLDTAIIFITVSTEHYPQSYEIGAHHYLVKPILYEQVAVALTRCKNHLLKAQKYIFISPQQKIYIKDICYLEVLHNTTTIYTTNRNYRIHIPLNKILEDIQEKSLVRIHKSFAVHLKYIQGIQDNQVILITGEHLNIGRKYFKDLKLSYWDYLTSQEDENDEKSLFHNYQ